MTGFMLGSGDSIECQHSHPCFSGVKQAHTIDKTASLSCVQCTALAMDLGVDIVSGVRLKHDDREEAKKLFLRLFKGL